MIEEVGKVKGTALGQNNVNADPLAVFDDHMMVQLKLGNGKSVLYDPSYGKIYAGQAAPALTPLAQFENENIGYFGLRGGNLIALRVNKAAEADLTRKNTSDNGVADDLTSY